MGNNKEYELICGSRIQELPRSVVVSTFGFDFLRSHPNNRGSNPREALPFANRTSKHSCPDMPDLVPSVGDTALLYSFASTDLRVDVALYSGLQRAERF